MASYDELIAAGIPRHPTIERCIEVEPRLAFRRYINSPEIADILKLDRGTCRLCEQKCIGRRTSWCTAACKQEALVYLHPSWAARTVWKRDRVCVICGATGFEVDHIVPVVLGGGLCSLKGLRLLCEHHHREETARLREHLKQKRRCA